MEETPIEPMDISSLPSSPIHHRNSNSINSSERKEEKIQAESENLSNKGDVKQEKNSTDTDIDKNRSSERIENTRHQDEVLLK